MTDRIAIRKCTPVVSVVRSSLFPHSYQGNDGEPVTLHGYHWPDGMLTVSPECFQQVADRFPELCAMR